MVPIPCSEMVYPRLGRLRSHSDTQCRQGFEQVPQGGAVRRSGRSSKCQARWRESGTRGPANASRPKQSERHFPCLRCKSSSGGPLRWRSPMKMYLRLLRVLLQGRRRARISLWESATLTFRVHPLDLDVLRHMNNGT